MLSLNETKKIAIVSCYFKNNYGSLLQAYATQRILDKYDIMNETISIEGFSSSLKKKLYIYYLKNIFNLDLLRAKIGMLKLALLRKINWNNLEENTALRNLSYSIFRNYIKLSKEYTSIEELSESSSEYAAFLVGSDQLWLPANIYVDYYTLSFVPDDVPKISYATSFGVSNLPSGITARARKFLKRIDYLSVREQAGVNIVRTVAGITADLVCDPTLLLDKKDWNSIKSDGSKIEREYVFCYFLGGSQEHRRIVKSFAKQNCLEIVSILHLDEYVAEDEGFADVSPYELGPDGFIELIDKAKFVFTDSYHGTIFSLIYEKEFFVFERFYDENRLSTNSRIYSILDKFSLGSRLIRNISDFENAVTGKLNYSEINIQITQFRNESISFLLKSVGKEI